MVEPEILYRLNIVSLRVHQITDPGSVAVRTDEKVFRDLVAATALNETFDDIADAIEASKLFGHGSGRQMLDQPDLVDRDVRTHQVAAREKRSFGGLKGQANRLRGGTDALQSRSANLLVDQQIGGDFPARYFGSSNSFGALTQMSCSMHCAIQTPSSSKASTLSLITVSASPRSDHAIGKVPNRRLQFQIIWPLAMAVSRRSKNIFSRDSP